MEYFENQKKIEIPQKYKFVIRYYHKLKNTHLYISSKLKYDSKDIALQAGKMKLAHLRQTDENIGKARIRAELGQISKKEVMRKLSLASLKEDERFISQWSIIRNIKKYSIDEVLSKYNEEDNLVDFDGDLIPMGSDRYQNFIEHGVICTCCGLEGKYFYKEKFVNDEGYHFNLYGIDKDGNEVQMTKDHVVPKSKGGANHIDNYQPLCEPCNKRKKSIDNDTFMKESLNNNKDNKEKKTNKQLSLTSLRENEIYMLKWGIIRNTKKYSIEEVLSKHNADNEKIDFDGDLIPMGSARYANFKKHGVICACCGLEGKYFYKERFRQNSNYHFNLYGIDKDGNEILMTKDHIIPKSQGGKDCLKNYQPFCEICNNLKGSQDNDTFIKEHK
jgi:5-methylcytosine-specific restriction endonuclease McrA